MPQKLPSLRPNRAKKGLYGRTQRQAHNGAWGGELAGSFDNVPGSFNYGFVGALGCRQDPSSGLVYMRARWFEPSLQRFISRDPVGLSGGRNSYQYANNQPAKNTDSTGLFVDYKRKGRKITLTLPIAYCNDGLDPKDFEDAIAKFNTEIIRVWGGQHDGYEVQIIIVVTRENCLCNEKDVLDRARREKRVNHVRLIKGTGRSTTGRGIGNTGDWYAGNAPVTGSHEGGHLLGVKDNYPYDDEYAPPPQGYEDDIMSNFWDLYNQGVPPIAGPGRIQSIVDYWESSDVRELMRGWPR